MKVPYIKIWTDRDAECGNIYRVLWANGRESGFPTRELRTQVINALA